MSPPLLGDYSQEGAQNSVKGVHFGTHKSRVSVHASHEALTLHSPVAHPRSPSLTLLARCECLKRHGVGEREGELGADFDSETSAFTSQSKLSRISFLSFLWCCQT